MTALYRTEARNRDGGDGVSRIPGGLEVAVSSPLGADFGQSATNPEQLLALAWATCFNATAQRIVERQRRTAVRVEVGLHQADAGYEFHVDAYLSVEGATDAETAEIAAAAHARCPVSKLLRTAPTVHVHAEPYEAG